jgi:hypothetical protein
MAETMKSTVFWDVMLLPVRVEEHLSMGKVIRIYIGRGRAGVVNN